VCAKKRDEIDDIAGVGQHAAYRCFEVAPTGLRQMPLQNGHERRRRRR
jgi:hypothetical protein